VVSLLIIGATAFSWYRRQDKIEQELRVKKKLTELELANLRIQMNPHFIFNCLDTVKLQEQYVTERRTLQKTSYVLLMVLGAMA
jgi:LytS/YehU family sensor histidine kinase